MNTPADETLLRDAVRAAADRADVLGAVGRLYVELAGEVERRRPVCDASGRCCRFETYGHRMYVSTIELAKFVADLAAASPAERVERWDGTGCVHQVNGLCGVHSLRPLGCRIFFCDPTSTAWQNGVYERLHSELRHLHEALDVPYLYVEWRAALKALGLAVVREGAVGEDASWGEVRVRLSILGR